MRSITDGLEERPKGAPGGASGGPGLRDKLNGIASGPLGKAVLVIVALAMVGLLLSRFQSAVGPDTATVLEARSRLMDPLTGKLRWHTVTLGSRAPEGFYPVEYCWNNHPEDLAVPVVLNRSLFPPGDPRRDEATLCPCCAAAVVGRNPKPEEFLGMTPKDYDSGQAPACVVEQYRAVLGN